MPNRASPSAYFKNEGPFCASLIHWEFGLNCQREIFQRRSKAGQKLQDRKLEIIKKMHFAIWDARGKGKYGLAKRRSDPLGCVTPLCRPYALCGKIFHKRSDETKDERGRFRARKLSHKTRLQVLLFV